MEKRLSWWQKIKRPVLVGIIATGVLMIALIVVVVLGYWFNWPWVGVSGVENKVTTTMITPGATTATPVTTVATETQPAKTLWDWLGLVAVLAIPVVVGFGAAWFTAQQVKVSDRKNTDNQRETALQAYINQMSELLLHENLRESDPQKEVRNIARVRTLTVLHRLDAIRKASVLQFLYESGLIVKDKRILDLSYADLSSANLYAFELSGANLSKVNLREAKLFLANLSGTNLNLATLTSANLHQANLKEANLEKAILDGADVSFANLSGANLSGAILYYADLKGAKNITTEELEKQTKSLKGATMPDGSIHP